MNFANELCDRYVAVWNERRARARAAAAGRQAAGGMKMSAVFEVRGHRELEIRVTDAHERFIASGEYDFRRCDDAERLRDVVKFRWEMISTQDGSVAGVGLEFLVMDAEGRIRSDYQFIES